MAIHIMAGTTDIIIQEPVIIFTITMAIDITGTITIVTTGKVGTAVMIHMITGAGITTSAMDRHTTATVAITAAAITAMAIPKGIKVKSLRAITDTGVTGTTRPEP